MLEPTNQEVMEAVTAIRDLTDSLGEKNVSKAEFKERAEKIDAFLDIQETKNQEYLKESKASADREAEQKERMDTLEKELARRGEQLNEKDYRQAPEYKALEAYAQHGDVHIDAEVKATLRTDADIQGGYTVTGEMDNMITKKITEISGIRQVARIRTIGTKSLEMPIRSGILTATYEGEAESGSESNSEYGSESLLTFRQTVTVPITLDLLMNSSFKMESEIFGDAAEAFAQGEGLNFILGDDHKKPQGILTHPDIVAGVRTSSTSGDIEADDMILLTGDLKTGYNPVYTLSRGTLALLRTKKSTDGVYLWQPGLNGPVANTMNGFSYVLSQDMPAVASNSLSVAFGDFQRGYTIVDRTGVSIIRDELTRKKEGIVEFTINRWNYGKVTLAEAIKVLKTAA